MTARTPLQRIDVGRAEIVLSQSDPLVLDARDAGSFATSRIDGAQPVSSANLGTLIVATARTRPVLIYCYHGNASREYAQAFSDFGFAEVYSLDGGYEAWCARPPADAASREAVLQQWLATQSFAEGEINAVIANAMTPLMKASCSGECDIVGLLISAGASVNARNADGNNALWLACVGSHLEVINMLVAAGIDIDNRNDNGATALMYAASSGKAAVVERLLAKGADVSAETPDGFSALDLAGNLECVALLRPARSQAGSAALASP